MIIWDNNKPLYREKYYFRDRRFTLENRKFGVYSFFDSEFLPGYSSVTSERLGFYLLYIVTKGKLEDTDPTGRKSTLSRGGFSLNPCENNYTSRAVGGKCVRKCFHIYKTEFTKALVSLFFPEGFVKLQLSDPAGTEKIFDRIKEEFCRPDPGPDPSPLMGLVTELMEFVRGQLPAQGYSARVNEILAFIENQLGNPELDREMICEKCSISTSSLDRLFKRQLNGSVSGYIRNKRLEQITSLLAIPGLRINEIASSAGFSNVIYMNSLFRKTFGVTPSQYRRKILQEKKPYLVIG